MNIQAILDDGTSESDGAAALALGNFDGVHLGHQYLIKDMLELAGEMRLTSTVCTFTPHPERYYGFSVPMISTCEQKLALFDKLGVQRCFLVKFDAAFAALDPHSFMEDYLVRRLKGEAIVVGDDFRFGKGRAGDTEMLRRFCGEQGIVLSIIPRIQTDGTIISSTVIRRLTFEGAMDQIPQYLGRYLSCVGEVVHGDHLGSKLGFPTANLRLESELIPPDGSYAGYIEEDGQKLPAMLYVGKRPTVADALERRFEVNVIGGNRGDMYGRRLEVFITARLRPDQKYASLDELKARLRADQEAVLKMDIR